MSKIRLGTMLGTTMAGGLMGPQSTPPYTQTSVLEPLSTRKRHPRPPTLYDTVDAHDLDIQFAIVAIAIALLLFLLQVVPYLSHRWVTDESWYSTTAYSIAHGTGVKSTAIGPNDIQSRFDARPPGTAIVIAGAFHLFGESQVPARLGSVLAGIAIVLLTFLLAYNVLSEEAAYIATFLVATDNFIVLVSRSARPEALTVVAILGSMLLMKKYAGNSEALWAFLSGIAIGIGTMFHITVLGYVVSLAILAVVLDIRRKQFPLKGIATFSTGYLISLVPFAAWILSTPGGREAFRIEYLKRSANGLARVLQEGYRYHDMLGFGMVHKYGLQYIPLRLPIPLFFLVATYLLWKMKRQWFYLEVLFVVPTMLWFAYTPNKSSRYFALLAPIFALVIGAAVSAIATFAKPNWLLHRVMGYLVYLIVVMQLVANVFLLYGARQADYNKVGAELRSVIPQGQTAYGTITFWLAFKDRPYVSYERTDPLMAANELGVHYFITGDPILAGGQWVENQPGDNAYRTRLRASMNEVVARSVLVGHFPDQYYGDLRVYRFEGWQQWQLRSLQPSK